MNNQRKDSYLTTAVFLDEGNSFFFFHFDKIQMVTATDILISDNNDVNKERYCFTFVLFILFFVDL